MALYIREYDRLGSELYGVTVQAGVEPAVATQRIASVTATPTQSAAFQTRTKMVRVSTDAACVLEFGLNPTALQTGIYMAAGQTEFFALDTDVHKAATPLMLSVRTP